MTIAAVAGKIVGEIEEERKPRQEVYTGSQETSRENQEFRFSKRCKENFPAVINVINVSFFTLKLIILPPFKTIIEKKST